jgi:multiple sugar transport system permease protein
MKKRQVALHIFLSIGLVFLLFPLLWTLLSSLEHPSHALSFPQSLIPQFDLGNYLEAWQAAPWLHYFANTLFIATSTTLLVLLTSLPAAYTFSTLRFRGRDWLFGLVLLVLLVPSELALVPQYLLFADLHWINTYAVQILPWGASAFGIFLLRQFLLSLPRELLEAARLDGAGELAVLRYIVAPLVRPALVTLGVYVFLGAYNSFLWPLIVTNGDRVRPIEVGLAAFQSANGTAFTELSAAAIFTTLPVIFLFLLAQRQIVESVSRTGSQGIS